MKYKVKQVQTKKGCYQLQNWLDVNKEYELDELLEIFKVKDRYKRYKYDQCLVGDTLSWYDKKQKKYIYVEVLFSISTTKRKYSMWICADNAGYLYHIPNLFIGEMKDKDALFKRFKHAKPWINYDSIKYDDDYYRWSWETK